MGEVVERGYFQCANGVLIGPLKGEKNSLSLSLSLSLFCSLSLLIICKVLHSSSFDCKWVWSRQCKLYFWTDITGIFLHLFVVTSVELLKVKL